MFHPLSCVQHAPASAKLKGNEVSLTHARAIIGFAAALAGPHLVAGAKFAKRAAGHFGRRSAQRMVSAAWTGFARRLARQLFVRLEGRNPRFQRSDSFRGFRQRFPDGRFIKDFQNV